MRRQHALFLIFSILFCFSKLGGQTIQDFSLRNVDGRLVSLSDYKDAKGFIIVFTCNHCPFAQLYYDRINALNTQFSKQHIPLIAINSMDSLLYEDEEWLYMQTMAKKNAFNFPYLQDPSQSVGKNFGATHTPQTFLIWKENNEWHIKYRGAIDDNGEYPKKATSYIALAIQELLAGKQVSRPVMNAIGCKIMYRNELQNE